MTITLPSLNLGSSDTVIFLLVGAIAGFLASRAIAGHSNGVLIDVVIGIIGAFLGRWLFGVLGISLGAGVIPDVIVAFVGAAVLLLVVGALTAGRGRRRRGRTLW